MNKKEGNGLFGYKFFIVLSDSMKPDFQSGDIIISKADIDTGLGKNDIITFSSIDPASYGEIITHRIVGNTEHEFKPAFITQGSNVDEPDQYPVPEDKVIGRYLFAIPKAGYLFQFLKSPMGYILLIFTPFFFLIVIEGYKFFRLLSLYKNEQQAEMRKQIEELEAEKRKAEEAYKELALLTEQMEKTQKETAVGLAEVNEE